METPVEIWTDYKNLEYFMTAENFNCKQVWWLFYLTQFNFILHYQLEKSMEKSDALSWRLDHDSSSHNN